METWDYADRSYSSAPWCSSYSPRPTPPTRARIAYLIGVLRGEALTWATVVWERGSTACFDYSAFTEEMQRVFHHPVRGREASQCLLLLCQGSRSVASFAVEFRTLAVESGWNEEALQGVFLNALGGDVKDEFDLPGGVLGSRAPDRSRHSGGQSLARTPQGEGSTLFFNAFFHASCGISPSSFGFLSTASRADTSFWFQAHADRTHATSPPRRGSTGFSPEPASTVVRRATSCLDVPLTREKGQAHQ